MAQQMTSVNATSVESLPPLKGELTLYLGRGEGGLYEDVLNAIQERNPEFTLNIRRGPTAALANAIMAESKAGIRRADLFWAVDSGAIGMVVDAGLATTVPNDVRQQLLPQFRFSHWTPISGRVRTLPFNSETRNANDIPDNIFALPNSGLRIAWAPAYASFQSFVTAMRLHSGEEKTLNWLKQMKQHATRYAGELGVVMAVERGEVDVGLANHYYTLRLKKGKPNANVDLAFTQNDAGSLINASGIVALNDNKTAVDFIRYLLTKEVQTFLASEAYELPMVQGIASPQGLPSMDQLAPPKVDLTELSDLRPTLNLMRKAGVL
ncbi:substrate-binding domain-containing protein [Bermanella marisrubri]|nr:substrate-binding domain-containing protein [Bermanella marisrubri]